MVINYLIIALTILISVTGQTLLKTGMTGLGKVDSLDMASVVPLVLRMATNIWVILGLSFFVIGTFFWLVLLSRLDLSYVYPFGALQYVLIFSISYFFLHEQISGGRIVGVLFILAGILIIGKFG